MKIEHQRTLMPLLLATLSTAASACGGSGAPPAKARSGEGAPVTAAEKAEVLERRDQRAAQRAWCDYLRALYVRASEPAVAWPRYAQCLEGTTTAAPRMLKRTAECSLAALKRFEGDPFTPEYAAEVSRCGADAIDGMAVSHRELAPYVAAICGRMTRCGNVEYSECQAGLREGLGPHLERAIGAVNSRARAELRGCLGGVACDQLGREITACVEPLMENLLWLPE